MRVAIVGCGLIGRKRAAALRSCDELVACTDTNCVAAEALAAERGAVCCSFEQVLELTPDAVVVATPHDQLAPLATAALLAGAHVLVEKPAGLGSTEVVALEEVARKTNRLVKVGFNHRFHPAIARVAAEVQSGQHGAFLHLRARYGHGGRPGYEREWRTDPARSGGGELIDQGMHLLDICHWLAGPLPLHSALLRTQFWDTSVEDNAALLLGDVSSRHGAWAMLHVSWTEWKNTFSLEVYCQSAKLEVTGLTRSYGAQKLTIYRMSPSLGPPAAEEIEYAANDQSWQDEWSHFAAAVAGEVELSGSLSDARYAWERVEDAYAVTPYAEMRSALPR